LVNGSGPQGSARKSLGRLFPAAFSLGVVIENGYFMLKKELGETPGIPVLARSRRGFLEAAWRV